MPENPTSLPQPSTTCGFEPSPETTPSAADRLHEAPENKDPESVEKEPALPTVNSGGIGQTFSQLLAAAGGGGRPSPILTVPVVAVPCYFTPAGLVESTGFTGQFAMTHQAVLASVTAQAQMQMQNALSPSSELITNTFSQPLLSPISPVPLQQLPSPLPEGAASDAYHWRKYGQKQVKSSDNSRSYYRCTDANCSAKKKVERRPDGAVVDVTYRGKHTHEPPKNYRYTRDKGHQNTGTSGEHESLHKGINPSSCKDDHNAGSETPEQQLFCSSDCEVDAGTKNDDDIAEEADTKRRLIESPKCSSAPAANKTVREYIVQTEIDARHLSDGYKWRKYGQKLVKGNPNPRSYYRCTHEGCPVRKHVERTSHDSKSLLITYEGKHNHEQPASKYSSDPSTPKGAITTASNEKLDSASSSLNKRLLLELHPDTATEAITPSSNKLLEEPRLDNATETIVDEKASNIEGSTGVDTMMESAQALPNVGLKSSVDENVDRMNSENVKNPLFNESKAAVPVQAVDTKIC